MFTMPAGITVSANATAPEQNDTVVKVDFFANGVSIGSASVSPYSINWANPAAGSYTLTAVATDGFGATKTSTARIITIKAQSAAAQAYYIHTDHLNTPRVITVLPPTEN